MVILNSFEGAVVIMTIKKTNLKYFLLPLISALFIVSLITLVLFTFFNGNKALVDTKLSYVVPSSLNDFDSIKKVNEISYLMDNYDDYYNNASDVIRVSDGYIVAHNQVENDILYTYILKKDFSGNDVWSYKYDNLNNFRYNMVLLNDKVYIAAADYGTLVLNIVDGSLYKYNEDFNYFDVQIYNSNIMMISHDEIVIVDNDLNIISSLKSNSLNTSEYKIYFDDFYVEDNNIYVLSTKELLSDGSYSPVIYTFDIDFNYIDLLNITYEDDDSYLATEGEYIEYLNFIKDDNIFYQVGQDIHKIDENGKDTLLIDYYLFENNEYNASVDILEFEDFFVTLDVKCTYTADGYWNDINIFLNVRNKKFEVVRQYKVNDNFIQHYSFPESMTYVDGKIVVKWYDWDTYEIYISEFEFNNETEKCVVVSGTGSNIGDEIKCGKEEFYVVENDGVNVKMMSKYNLLIGENYEKYFLDVPYETTDGSSLEEYLHSLPEFKEKLADGYVYMYDLYEYDSETSIYTLTGAALYKGINYKTGSVFCENTDGCTKDELLLLAAEKGFYSDDTYYNFRTYGVENNYSSIVFEYSNGNSYVIFDEPVATRREALMNSEVQEKLSEGYTFEYITLSDGSILGLDFWELGDNSSVYVFMDESTEELKDMLKSNEVQEYLNSGYSYSSSLLENDGSYIGAIVEYYSDNLLTVVMENSYTVFEDLLKSDELAPYFEAGYLQYSTQMIDGEYSFIEFLKYDDRNYKTIFFDTTQTTLPDIYKREDVQEYLNQGYDLYATRGPNTSYSCSANAFCKYNYFGVILVKYDFLDYKTIILDDPAVTYDDAINNQLVQDIIADGYSIDEALYSKYRLYVTNEDGTSTNTYPNYYFGVSLRKRTGNGSISSGSVDIPYIMKKLKPFELRQDESAIGAHGTEEGNPAPIEIGVVRPMDVWGYVVSDIYSTGYQDYRYYNDYPTFKYYHSYYSTLINDGYDVLDVNSITVGEINAIVEKVGGSELPLEEWYINAEEMGYDYVTENGFYILGSIKDYVPEEYNWLWSTTYWTRTFDDTEFYIYFIDTLGDLCLSHYCQGAIGAGLRPIVTMSVSSIEFNVYTEDDGNGKVVPSSNTAIKGDTITFETVPNDGFVLKDVTITDSLGNEIIYTDNKFEMPSADVTISATFEKIILIEPTISIVPNRDRNNPLDENVSFYVTITNPYDIPLTDVKVTSDSDFTSCFINCSVLENNIVEIPVLEAGSSISYSIFYYVTEVGTIKANVEILSANAESPYFFNHEEPYVANTEASTIALVQVCNVLDGDGNGGVNQYNLISYDLYGTALLDYWFTLKDNACVTLALETDITYNLYQLDRQEYKLISVEGLITSNEGSFILEPKEYNITFNNLYEKKNYFHSWNRVENDVIVNLDPS